jgi:hypothetical protein
MILGREGKSGLYDSFKIWERGVCLCICTGIFIEALARGCR